MHYLGIIIASIIGYFIGSISWSIVIVRWRRGIDIRTTGSGNAGATNTTRLLGKWWGLCVVFLDALKVVIVGFITVLISMAPSELFSQTSYYIPALFVLIGHCWPVYYKFKGGKAVASFLGLLFIINFWYLFIFLAIWFSVVAITRRVSVASIAAAIVIGILIWFPWLNAVDSFIYQWNGAELFWNQAWIHDGLRFTWLNYLHVPVFNYTVTHGLNAGGTDFATNGFASGMLEAQIVIIVGSLLLLLRHLPNMKRIVKDQEPETFPKLTDDEKRQLFELQHQPKPTRKQRQSLRELEKRQKAESKLRKIRTGRFQ